jgi:alcohol dehydrogenase
MRLLEPEGIVECPGGHFTPVELDLFGMYVRGVTFHTGVASAREHVEEAFDLLLRQRISPQLVHSAPQPIDAAVEVLREPSLKPVLVRPRLQR